MQSVEINPVTTVGCDQPQGVAADAANIHGLGNAAMNRSRGIGDESLGLCGYTAAAYFEAHCYVSCDDQRDQIGHGCSGNKQPCSAFWKTEDLAYPQEKLTLDFDGSLITACEIRIQPRRQHFRQHADRRAAAMHPSHEAGVNIAGGERQDFPHELLVD